MIPTGIKQTQHFGWCMVVITATELRVTCIVGIVVHRKQLEMVYS